VADYSEIRKPSVKTGRIGQSGGFTDRRIGPFAGIAGTELAIILER
jgi:hypothetical protein